MKKTLLLLFLSLLLGYANAQTRYVKTTATGLGDGSSWSNASGDLQAMIDQGGGSVYVATGIYKPTKKHVSDASDADPRDKSFVLMADVKVYGGFSGTNDAEGLNDRNFVLNETILDGDLGAGNNTYHVIYCGSTANVTLDGFTIRNGIANGSGTLTASERDAGAGVYFRSTGNNLELTNLVLYNNQAVGAGGAGYLRPSGNITWKLSKITAYDNSAISNGGVFRIYTGFGGEVDLRIDRFKAYNNTSGAEGGVFCFSNNTATQRVKPTITNSIFYNNSSTFNDPTGAGAIYLGSYVRNALIINNTFYNNKSRGNCGAISYNNNATTYSTFSIINNLFSENRSGASATLIYDIRNSGQENADAERFYKNNIFQTAALLNGINTLLGFQNNLYEDTPSKLFVTQDDTDASFLTIKESLATENGLNDYYTVGDKDFAGNERKVHTNVDIGAFEYQGTLPVTLVSFTVKAVGQTSRLDWSTTSENNNQKFVVERGRDLNSFTLLKNISPNIQGRYSYTDNNPLSGDNYYRLSQVDNDGKATVLGVEMVNHSLGNKGIGIYPVPAKNELAISFDTVQDKLVDIEIVTTNGQKVLTKALKFNKAVNTQTIEVSTLKAGNYILVIKTDGKVLKSQIISKID